MIPTAAQLAKLRSHPQATQLWLSIYQPSTVLACRVNDAAIAKGEREITFDTTTSGSYSDVRYNMMMRVGTTAGGEEKGRVRVKAASSTVITVAENSHINWADNDYLTVENFFEITAMYPRIVLNADDSQTWYKDYDLEYSNQNTAMGTFICMGSHYAGFTGNVYYTASGTYNVQEEALAYFWLFEGGDPTGSNLHTPGNVAYATPGHYTTRLITSGTSTGVPDASYRHISIYDRPGEGTNVPILNWELINFNGSRDQGGYTISIRIHQPIPKTQLHEGSLVVIFADDWYSDLVTKQSIGGNALNRETIVFCGYVLDGTIRYNYRDSYMDFDVGSPTEIMKISEGFSISVQSNADPATATSDPNIPSSWVTIQNMNFRKALYHYLRWHTTALKCCDFEFIGTDRPLQYFDADRTSIYNAINTLMEGALLGKVCSDRQGKIWFERDMWVEPTLFGSSFSVDSQDWMNDPSIDEQSIDKVSYVEAGGVAYTGPTGSYTALMSEAPGSTPGYRGSILRVQGLALLDQTEMNNIAGGIWANKNAEYPSIELALQGNYRNFDIAPQERIPLTLAATDTVRGISFTNKVFGVQGMRWSYNPGDETFLPTVDLKEMITGSYGDTLTIPTVPPEENGYSQPGIVFPQLVIPPFPVFNIGGGGGGDRPSFVPAVPQPTYSLDWVDAVTNAAMGFCYCGTESTLTVTPIIREVYAAANTGEIAVTFTVYVLPTCDDNTQSIGGSTNPYLYTMRTKGTGDQHILCLTDIITLGSNVPAGSIVMLFGQRTGGNGSDTYLSSVWMCGWYLEWV